MGQIPSKNHSKLIQKLKDTSNSHTDWSNISEIGDGAFGKLYLEFCKFGSFDLIIEELAKSGDELSEIQIKAVMRSVLYGLSYLHKQRIIHRDIKSSNIMLNESAIIKIADFGVAVLMNTEEIGRNSFIGTPYWMAPEVISCETDSNLRYNTSADIWSLGITGIELAQGKPPHDEVVPLRVGLVIIHSEPPSFENTNNWSNSFHTFITKDFNEKAMQSLVCFLSGELVVEEIIEDEKSVSNDQEILDSIPINTNSENSIRTSQQVLQDNSPRKITKSKTFMHQSTYIDEDGNFVIKETKRTCRDDPKTETNEITRRNLTVLGKNLKKKNLLQYRKWQDRNRKILKFVKIETTKSYDQLIATHSEMVNKIYHKVIGDLQKISKKRTSAVYSACVDACNAYKLFIRKMDAQESDDVKFYRKTLKQEYKRQAKVSDRLTMSSCEKNMIIKVSINSISFKEMDFVTEIKNKNTERNLQFYVNRMTTIFDIDLKAYSEKMDLILDCEKNLYEIKRNHQLEMEKLLLEALNRVYDIRAREQDERFQMVLISLNIFRIFLFWLKKNVIVFIN
ncbi:serine/threonine-protein kinase 3-like [Octopus sinensis]|uniref:Serine/threonine-protein kinase 3-like n=1 Tax=Octopus sinensis TaxID=2607531 RepID=A0A6P7TVT5_9MOLL|nr:serine/threonine-protein kinase 3-like [Octopus sinensis]